MKVINNKKHYTISEVAEIIGVTRCTILRWYEYEQDKEVKLLPSYITQGKANARYWSEDDIEQFKQFKMNTPRGAMADISNKYNIKKVAK